MSKVVIYVLDKIVWMLLITAVTTQALQIAGVVDTPKGLGDISYKQDNEYNFQVQVGESDVRGKRQASVERSPFIDSLFNVPISTLTAVNNLVQNSRPAFRSIREYAMKRFTDKSSSNSSKSSNEEQPNNNNNLLRKIYPVFLRPKEETTSGDDTAKKE